MDQAEIVMSQFLNFTLQETKHKTEYKPADYTSDVDYSYNCLKMHDMAFGLDPHVAHVALCEQQQPLSGDVILFEQIGVNLHVAGALL